MVEQDLLCILSSVFVLLDIQDLAVRAVLQVMSEAAPEPVDVPLKPVLLDTMQIRIQVA